MNGCCMCDTTVIRHPNDPLSLALIIGLAALGLLLLLLLLSSIIAVIATRRRRRKAKATDDGQGLSASSTVSINLTPSGSSCSRSSEESINGDVDEPSAPPTPPPPPPLPPQAFTNVIDQPKLEVESTPSDDLSGSRTELVGVVVGGNGRPSWTQSLPHVVAADLRKVPPPIVAKKTAKAQAVAQARRRSEDLIDVSVTGASADPLPGLGPERPRSAGPTGRYVHIPPKLHREPRGWAPASHAVPAPVKRTWGRAKAKMAAEQGKQEGDPSASMFNISTVDEENDIGSTMSLNI